MSPSPHPTAPPGPPARDDPWRLFLAIDLDAAARDALAHALSGEALPGRSVPPSNWHLTLRFLGDVGAEARAALNTALAATDFGPPFAVRLRGFGALPTPARARVLVANVEEPDGGTRLADVAARVEAAARAGGLPPETRPLRPHVTLARLRGALDVREGLERLAARGAPAVALDVREIVLFRSHLEPGGARYERIRDHALGEGAR